MTVSDLSECFNSCTLY